MNKEKVIYTRAPADIAKALKRSKAVADFLPPPEELVAREPRVKVTIVLNAKSINFFKKHEVRSGDCHNIINLSLRTKVFDCICIC